MAAARIPANAEVTGDSLRSKWIARIKDTLDRLFRDNPDVFVSTDLPWYPVEGDDQTWLAPDVMVVFGRPKGHRDIYRQCEEGGIAPQVVFEVLPPGSVMDGLHELERHGRFYERFGVEEYYICDAKYHAVDGRHRSGEELPYVHEMERWVSPRLGVWFDLTDGKLRLVETERGPLPDYAGLLRQRDEARRKVKRLEARLRALGEEL
jgi:Uma2 family endonuclease